MKACRLLFLLLLSVWTNVNAQTLSRTELEKEKKANLEKINTTQKILNQTRKQKTSSVGELRALNKQISSQEKQLSLMEQDLELIETELKGLSSETSQLEDKITVLRKEYADMLYQASKTSGRINQLSFILSSKSFNELVMRYKYIQQYGENRQQQVDQIKKTSAELTERQQQLAGKRTSQVTIKEQKLTEAQQLTKLKNEKSRVVTELSKQEKQLRAEIIATQRSVKKLDQRISSVIQREITRQNKLREEARKEEVAQQEALRREENQREEIRRTEARKQEARRRKEALASAPTEVPPPIIEKEVPAPAPEVISAPVKITAAAKEVRSVALAGATFAANQRRIPWPVKSGFVSDKFGVKNHPVLSGVRIDNNGVNIQTSAGATVNSVFDGTVMDVSDIPGLNRVVAIQHGEFFTIYANLQRVSVNSGQQVSMNQTIGTAATVEGITEINFQVWKNTSRLNPELWLVRK
jgi:septal ring factor EnvC (AmiA/AmiB activator)